MCATGNEMQSDKSSTLGELFSLTCKVAICTALYTTDYLFLSHFIVTKMFPYSANADSSGALLNPEEQGKAYSTLLLFKQH